jgi:hypothetical protein
MNFQVEQLYNKITDNDWGEVEFSQCYNEKVFVNIKKKRCIKCSLTNRHQNIHCIIYEPSEKKREGRPFKFFNKKDIYVKFTDIQREYMQELFKVNIYQNYIDVFHIIKKIGFIGQKITIKNIKSWFSNERFRKKQINNKEKMCIVLKK